MLNVNLINNCMRISGHQIVGNNVQMKYKHMITQ